MDETNVSLIRGAGAATPDAWGKLDRVYRPFLSQWFSLRGVRTADVDDLTQEVLVVVFDEIRSFRHSGKPGSFRSWLKNVCTNRLLAYLRSQRVRGAAIGGTDFQAQVNSVEESADLTADFDRKYDQALLREMVNALATEFSPTTMQAFRRLTFDAISAAEVAHELDLTVGAVYIAKSRVLRRLRELAAGEIDDSYLS